MLLPSALMVQNTHTHTHTHVRVGVMHVMEELLFGRLCPLSDSSVGHRSSPNIRDRVLACVSLSAASAVYCLPPSVTSNGLRVAKGRKKFTH